MITTLNKIKNHPTHTALAIGLVSSSELVKFEDLSVVIGDKSISYSPAPEDILN